MDGNRLMGSKQGNGGKLSTGYQKKDIETALDFPKDNVCKQWRI